MFTCWGGTTQEAQTKSWADPFEESSGIRVMLDGPTDYGKLKAMVEGGNVELGRRRCRGGFRRAAAQGGPARADRFHRGDRKPNSILASPPSMRSGASTTPSFSPGTSGVVGNEPKCWADMFDTKEIPGKRTFYKWSAPGVLEIALLADGVPADKLYPLDLDRAFKKLDRSNRKSSGGAAARSRNS